MRSSRSFKTMSGRASSRKPSLISTGKCPVPLQAFPTATCLPASGTVPELVCQATASPPSDPAWPHQCFMSQRPNTASTLSRGTWLLVSVCQQEAWARVWEPGEGGIPGVPSPSAFGWGTPGKGCAHLFPVPPGRPSCWAPVFSPRLTNPGW